MNSVADVWTNVLTQLKRDLSETTIATWFDELEAVDLRDGVFYLHCPNDFKKNYIESLFMKNIKAVLKDIFSTDFDVKVLSSDEYADFFGTETKRKTDAFTSEEFTFETFVVGPSNKLAYAASMSVAEHPAQNYNPLLIYGDSGLGKTHLINSIAHVIRKNNSRAKIAYVKGDDLTNELVDAIREGKTAEMREKYRKADLLLVDDVQFIAGRKQTQEEFFHTFNNLYESGKQIVLTSDRPPSEMTQLEDRLLTRFEWGLLVDVAPPDFETRLAIIKNKAASLKMQIPDKIAVYVAERVTSNVRQLEGTINKLLAYTDLLDDDMDDELVKRAIQDILRRGDNIPTPESIVDFVSKYYGVDAEIIRGQQRVREAVSARQVAMYLIRNITNLSSDDIGKIFGNRDHSTVLYSIEKVEKQMKSDAAFAETVKEIKTNISSKR
ncbi:MAG: chromosomal replication initiator protein DnaA [Oscillospiraceae bacterium]|nr:chromosomal replication initiator protein DnaA [Oscillospiraceae bacterium]